MLVFDEVEESDSVFVIREDQDTKGLVVKLDVPVDVLDCEVDPERVGDDVGVLDTRGLKDPVGDTFADTDSLFVNDCLGLNVVVEVRVGLQDFIDPGEFDVEGDLV